MNKFIIHFHSGIAYLVLIGLLLIILLGITGILGNKDVNKLDRVSLKITKGLIHLQALAGIILWVVSDKIQAYLQDPGAAMGNSASRRTFIEHPIMMLIAVVIFTIGSKKIATAKNSKTAYSRMALYGFITLAIFVAMIPWSQFIG